MSAVYFCQGKKSRLQNTIVHYDHMHVFLKKSQTLIKKARSRTRAQYAFYVRKEGNNTCIFA